MQPSFSLRDARQADQATITEMVRAARLYPADLHWPNFIVAEDEGRVVGIGQVKQHRDGSRELASVVVRRGSRGRGVGSALCQALAERESGPLYLMCRDQLEPFYARLDFRKVDQEALAPYFRRIFRLASVMSPALQGLRLIVMKRETGPA